MIRYNEKSNMLKGVFKPLAVGISVGVAACVVFLLLLSLAATVWSIPHAYVVPLGVAGAVFGAWCGGWSGAKIAGRNGWLVGFSVALILFVLSVVAGIGFYQQLQSGFLAIKCLLMLACGLLGGVTAVNTRKSSRKRYH